MGIIDKHKGGIESMNKNSIIKAINSDKKFLFSVAYYFFLAFVVVVTLWIFINSPVQKHFRGLANNDVWFGDGWRYVNGDGTIDTETEIKPHGRHYLRLDSRDNHIKITKTLDFTPSEDDYISFRVRAQQVRVYVNGEPYYEKLQQEKYKAYTVRMYMLHQFPVGGLKEGDEIAIDLSIESTSYFIVQFLALGDRYALSHYIFQKAMPNIMACVLAAILIVLAMMTRHSLFLDERAQGENALKWLIIFLITAIVYISMDSGCMEIYLERMAFTNWLGCVSLLMLPIPFILYTQYAFFPGHRRYEALAVVNFIITLSSIIGYITVAYNIANSYIYVHILIAVAIVCCFISFIQEKLLPSPYVVIGYLSICAMAIISIIGYWEGLIYPASMLFGYGLVIFGLCMLLWTVQSNAEFRKMREEADLVLMQRDKQEAEDASEQKSRFLSHMSHEIRTPLNAVIGMNELIMHETDIEQIRKYSVNIQSASNSLLALINDVLDFSKIETGKMDIINSTYSLSSTLNDVVLMTQGRAADKGLELRLNIDKEMPDVLRGDEVRIKQIILNLMTNAVKYTEKGWIELSVNTTYSSQYLDERDDVNLNIRVSDSGIGIKSEEQSKLFVEFERLDREKNRSIEGTGLGLSITSQLINLMGGKISVESKYGAGTSFMVSIPQKVVSHEPIGDYKKRFERLCNEKEEETLESLENMRFNGKKVFVVDDNDMNLEVIASILEMLEITVGRAVNGREALAALGTELYDLILTDDMMPEMSGTELMESIKKDTEGINYATPIVVLTANAVVGVREEYINKGFDDYMTKPLDVDVLQKILVRYLK